MKVLHVINNLNTGGAEKLLLETLPLYNKKGITVDLLLLNSKEYPFLNKLKKENCCTIHNIGEGSVYNPLLIFKISSILKQYDIAHGHIFPTFYWLALAKVFSFSKTKLVYTEHNTTNKRQKKYLYKVIDRQIYKIYNHIVSISSEIKSILKKHAQLKENEITIIENGVNLSIIKNASPLKKEDIHVQIKETDQLLIQVSSLTKQKDHDTLIKSLLYLPKTIKLILIGDGELRKRYEELITSLSLEKRVFLLGVRMDVPNLLKISDIIILSSHHEGLSLSAIEAMASGKPFVASNVNGLSTMVQNAGILFEEGNEIELSEHIKKLINQKSYAQEVAFACQARAEEYNIEQMINKHINLYKNIVNNKDKNES